MKVKFIEGFKLVLIAENELERLFMLEWDIRAHTELTDNHDRDCRYVDPAYIKWETDCSGDDPK